MAAGANSWLPVSTNTRPSPVATALRLANDGTNAHPSATSATPPRGANGCACSMGISPSQRRSATSRTSSATLVAGGGHLVEHQGPRHVDSEEHDEGEEDGLDPDRCADVGGHVRRGGNEQDEEVEHDRHRRLDLPQPSARSRDRGELEVAEDQRPAGRRYPERHPPHGG